MVALEVVEVVTEMTVVQVQMLLVFVVGFDYARKKTLQVWLVMVMVVVEMAVVVVTLVKKMVAIVIIATVIIISEHV